MDLEKLKEQIRAEGYIKPEVMLITPEIRSIDERVAIDIIEDIEDINI